MTLFSIFITSSPFFLQHNAIIMALKDKEKNNNNKKLFSFLYLCAFVRSFTNFTYLLHVQYILKHVRQNEYLELRKQCQEFATALLDHTRSSHELEVLLNHDPTGPAFEHGERMHLNRLKLAVKLRQKKVSFRRWKVCDDDSLYPRYFPWPAQC